MSAIEHKSVLEAARRLERDGWALTVVPVRRDGLIDLDALERAVTDADRARQRDCREQRNRRDSAAGGVVRDRARQGALLHSDAAQAAGKIPLDVEAIGDRPAVAHGATRCTARKAAARCSSARARRWRRCICGGGQERGLRSGTLNVPGIVGLGRACALARTEMPAESARIARACATGCSPACARRSTASPSTASLERRLPNNLHVSFAGVDGESLLIGIGDIAVSTGSACSSASATPSHVLAAIAGSRGRGPVGVDPLRARAVHDGQDIDYAIEKFTAVVRHLRQTRAHAGTRATSLHAPADRPSRSGARTIRRVAPPTRPG